MTTAPIDTPITTPAEWAPQKAIWTAWPADPGEWNDDLETPRRDVAALVRAGALTGLSVGYRALSAKQGAWRTIARAALIEVSLVAQPMQPGARVDWIAGAGGGSGAG